MIKEFLLCTFRDENGPEDRMKVITKLVEYKVPFRFRPTSNTSSIFVRCNEEVFQSWRSQISRETNVIF